MDTPDSNEISKDVSQSVSVDAARSSGSSAAYARSEQRISQDLSLKQISQIFVGNWLLFVVLFIIMAAGAVVIYATKIQYVANATITVNDTQNSSLQSFASHFFGQSKSVAEGKKNNTPLLKHAEYLTTTDFYEILLADIQKRGEARGLSIAEKKGYQEFKQQHLEPSKDSEAKMKILSALDAMSKTKLDTDFELKVSYAAPSKEMATFLTNTAVQTTLNSLKQRELSDILKIENFITEQRAEAEKNMNSFNQQLAEFQNKPENLLSLSSKEKVAEYLSDLIVRKNELRMKISENEKLISYLSQGQTGRRESRLYGNGGRIEALRLENQMHQSQLGNIQASIDRVGSMAKVIPVSAQVLDDLRKKSEIEFTKYRDLTEASSKAKAQRLSLESRFEILETARLEKVGPQVSLMVLLLLAFVFSQVIGSLIIYVSYIWDSNTVTAQSSRNVVIIDSHSLDPRVIIENSKIRFRLRDSGFDDDGDTADYSDGSKKLTFRIFNKKSAIGED